MREELDNKICCDFPQLFADRHADASVSPMCWGFSCSDGWYDIIYELSSKLDTLFKKHNLVGEAYPKCAQVKEKFGTLRFYMDSIPKEISDEAYSYISEAEEKSGKTCEVCGNPGSIVCIRSWYTCLCGEHTKEAESRRLQV